MSSSSGFKGSSEEDDFHFCIPKMLSMGYSQFYPYEGPFRYQVEEVTDKEELEVQAEACFKQEKKRPNIDDILYVLQSYSKVQFSTALQERKMKEKEVADAEKKRLIAGAKENSTKIQDRIGIFSQRLQQSLDVAVETKPNPKSVSFKVPSVERIGRGVDSDVSLLVNMFVDGLLKKEEEEMMHKKLQDQSRIDDTSTDVSFLNSDALVQVEDLCFLAKLIKSLVDDSENDMVAALKKIKEASKASGDFTSAECASGVFYDSGIDRIPYFKPISAHLVDENTMVLTVNLGLRLEALEERERLRYYVCYRICAGQEKGKWVYRSVAVGSQLRVEVKTRPSLDIFYEFRARSQEGVKLSQWSKSVLVSIREQYEKLAPSTSKPIISEGDDWSRCYEFSKGGRGPECVWLRPYCVMGNYGISSGQIVCKDKFCITYGSKIPWKATTVFYMHITAMPEKCYFYVGLTPIKNDSKEYPYSETLHKTQGWFLSIPKLTLFSSKRDFINDTPATKVDPRNRQCYLDNLDHLRANKGDKVLVYLHSKNHSLRFACFTKGNIPVRRNVSVSLFLPGRFNSVLIPRDYSLHPVIMAFGEGASFELLPCDELLSVLSNPSPAPQ